ncbi:hypothetical protein [Frigoriflavimonas asaccharolytica]|uniref:Uncharacterized protein n=1 Tax=Frigoriflavimonas asaccharolytica TaxID=2735899 RepID=A0A8J8G8Y9_9FLAO|nr:hypothetical protein [Frigoriflavimonas asaccharolytica]NRS93506.1 hypothetical protein [Frigoriflavimonas asaccharolytica]
MVAGNFIYFCVKIGHGLQIREIGLSVKKYITGNLDSESILIEQINSDEVANPRYGKRKTFINYNNMTIQEKFYSIIDELFKNNPSILKINSGNKVSSILLFKDFINIIKIWKDNLNLAYTPFARKISLDNQMLINDINQNWHNQLPTITEFKEYVSIKYNFEFSTNVLNYVYIYFYITWEVFKDKENVIKFNLQNPYKGLIQLFIQDNIYMHEGIYIGNITMSHSKSINFKLPSIDNDFLDYIDKKCKLVGSDGIPNQEEVNQLWEEFQKPNVADL